MGWGGGGGCGGGGGWYRLTRMRSEMAGLGCWDMQRVKLVQVRLVSGLMNQLPSSWHVRVAFSVTASTLSLFSLYHLTHKHPIHSFVVFIMSYAPGANCLSSRVPVQCHIYTASCYIHL